MSLRQLKNPTVKALITLDYIKREDIMKQLVTRRKKRGILGRYYLLLSFNMTRTPQKTTRSTVLQFQRVYSLPR
jgi:hypothetical protein